MCPPEKVWGVPRVGVRSGLGLGLGYFLVRVGPQKPLLATIKRQKLARFGHVTRHDSLSKTILQGNPGGWATPWSAEEMLDGKHQRVDIPAHARTANKGLLQKRLEEDLCWIVPHVPSTIKSDKRLKWPELKLLVRENLVRKHQSVETHRCVAVPCIPEML